MGKKARMNLSAKNNSAVNRAFLSAAALMFAVVLFLTGCAPNPGGLSDGSGTETPNSRTICAKWEITDPGIPLASIELTGDEIYIVVVREENSLSKTGASSNTINGASHFGKTAPLFKEKAGQLISATPAAAETAKFYTGKYTFLEDSTVHLIDFGILEIDLSSGKGSDQESPAVIKLHPDRNIFPIMGILPTLTYEFNAERAVEIASSTNTELICRNWNYERYLLDGELFEPWEEPQSWESWEFPKSKPQISILFSKAGTYLQTLTVDGAQTVTVLGRWKWVDENQTAFYYSAGGSGDWQTDIINIVTLTETSFATAETLDSKYILTSEFF